MAKESIATRFIKKLKRLFASQTVEPPLRVLQEPSSPANYVNLLLMDMFKKATHDIDLYEDRPLPEGFEGFEPDLFENVTYDQVASRLSQMATSTGPNGEPQINSLIHGRKYICSVDIGVGKCHLTLKQQQ
ncbi:MAG: hypothetical protein JSU94_15950 [Phycisphaerales bacterium]|nr:MAG: hypothetical protein JSU94_15950 [Phycisphaerales bacterium]